MLWTPRPATKTRGLVAVMVLCGFRSGRGRLLMLPGSSWRSGPSISRRSSNLSPLRAKEVIERAFTFQLIYHAA